MAAKHWILGLLGLILLGALLTALYRLSGGLGNTTPAAAAPIASHVAQVVAGFFVG